MMTKERSPALEVNKVRPRTENPGYTCG